MEIPTSKLPITRARSKSPTVKPTAQAIKAMSAKLPPSGGAYSMTNKPSARAVATRPTEPRPISFQVTAEPSGSVQLEIDGRTIALTRREARTLADKLLRCVK